MVSLFYKLWFGIKNEPVVVNALIAAGLAALGVLVDVLEASGSTVGGFVALVLAAALNARRQVSPI